MFEEEKEEKNPSIISIKVIGVGGGGGNAVSRMFSALNTNCIEFIIANTDLQDLEKNPVPNKIQLGSKLTRGLGAGSIPAIGERAAQEDREVIKEALAGANMVFITAGLGGGTGTGASPIVAEIAKEIGALTVGVVTKPFLFEGTRKMRQAQEGWEKLIEKVDTLITIPNQRLFSIIDKNTSVPAAFKMVDDILYYAIQCITEIITVPGLINVDFADVKTIMEQKGKALMGRGLAEGEDRAKRAAKEAINSPLLEETSINGATGILINITGGEDLSLSEVDDACNLIIEKADKDVNCIHGVIVDKDLPGKIKIAVIATGFGKKEEFPGSAIEIKKEIKPFLETLEIPTFLRKNGNRIL